MRISVDMLIYAGILIAVAWGCAMAFSLYRAILRRRLGKYHSLKGSIRGTLQDPGDP